MNQKDKEQKRNCPATLEGKIWSSQMNVTWKYKPFLLSLAPSFSHSSRKRMFLQSEQKYDWPPAFTFLCCKMNVTCSDSSSGERGRSGGYFPKWNLKPQSPVHKRQNESPEEATCLQNSLKAMQGWMNFLPQWKHRWHQDSTSKLQQFGRGRKPSETGAQPRSADSHALSCPGWPGWLVADEVPSHPLPARTSSRWDAWIGGSCASKARDTLWLIEPSPVLGFQGPPSFIRSLLLLFTVPD